MVFRKGVPSSRSWEKEGRALAGAERAGRDSGREDCRVCRQCFPEVKGSSDVVGGGHSGRGTWRIQGQPVSGITCPGKQRQFRGEGSLLLGALTDAL